MEIAKYCGNKSVSDLVGELSDISKKNKIRIRRKSIKQEVDLDSPNIIVNINYIFPGCNPDSVLQLQSNILPAAPSSSNFIFDWNQGKLCADTVKFDESRFSEISNESISSASFNINSIPVSTPIKEKVNKKQTSVGKRRRSSISPIHKRKKDSTLRNVFVKFIVDYRWNHIHKVLRIFKVPLIYYIARQLKALELYTDLLEDLKMNCKKGENSVQKRLKDSDDDPIPKSKKAARMEENFRHMLMPDSKEETNRKDECKFWFTKFDL